MDSWVLGLGGSHHNGSACLLHGGRIVAATQEERLVGVKRYPLEFGANSLAVRYCLDAAGINATDLDLIVCCPTAWSKERSSEVLASPILAPLKNRIPVHFVPHHLSHAAGAYATSGFTDAAVLVADGMGSPYCDLTREERLAVKSGLSGGSEAHSFYEGRGGTLTPLEKHLIADGRWLCYNSRTETVDLENNPVPLAPAGFIRENRRGMGQFLGLGHMYDRVATQIFGDPHTGPGKVMGLAPYGVPSFEPSDFFKVNGGTFEFLPTVPAAFQLVERYPEHEKEYQDLAAATQKAFEEGMLHLVAHLRTLSKSENLVIAGGCALNSVANERIHNESAFRNVYIIPAAEDSGISLGAAYLGHLMLGGTLEHRELRRDSLGRSYSDAEIDAAIRRVPMVEVVDTTGPGAVDRGVADLRKDRRPVSGWIGAWAARAWPAQHSVRPAPRGRQELRQRACEVPRSVPAFRPSHSQERSRQLVRNRRARGRCTVHASRDQIPRRPQEPRACGRPHGRYWQAANGYRRGWRHLLPVHSRNAPADRSADPAQYLL
jgi:carbamoyltransferase